MHRNIVLVIVSVIGVACASDGPGAPTDLRRAGDLARYGDCNGIQAYCDRIMIGINILFWEPASLCRESGLGALNRFNAPSSSGIGFTVTYIEPFQLQTGPNFEWEWHLPPAMMISADNKQVSVNSWWIDYYEGFSDTQMAMKLAHEEWAHAIMGEGEDHSQGYWWQAETTCNTYPGMW